IGTKLMNTALDAFGRTQDLRIEFVRGNPSAQAFYERRGFRFDFEEKMAEGLATVWLRRPAGRVT
ncbi:MAG: GNAT family N-acetyltransferase, partial [Glutamicibacter sp.]